MSTALSAQQKAVFETDPVASAVIKLSGPTALSQLIMTLYNLADTLFVGQLDDPDQVAAIAIVLPIQLSLTALSNLFGIGAGTLISRSLGENKPQRACIFSSFAFYSALSIAAAYALAVLIFPEPFLDLLGAVGAVRELARVYIKWVLVFGGLPSMFNMTFAHLIRAEGYSRQASIGLSFGGILNMILDPIFILPSFLGLELEGAAQATFISNMAATAFFIIFYLRRKSKLTISIRRFDGTFRPATAKDVLKFGFPASLQMLLNTVSNMVLNNIIMLSGAAAMAGVGICKKLDAIPFCIIMGISQGVVPMMAYNYGARNIRRMRSAFKVSTTFISAFALVTLALIQVFPNEFVSLFIRDDETVAYAVRFIRIHSLSLPLSAMTMMIISFFLAIGDSKRATGIAVIRKGILDVPVMTGLNQVLPLYGAVITQPIMDTVSTAVAVVLYCIKRKSVYSPEYTAAS